MFGGGCSSLSLSLSLSLSVRVECVTWDPVGLETILNVLDFVRQSTTDSFDLGANGVERILELLRMRSSE